MEPITLRYQLDAKEIARVVAAHSPAVRAAVRRTRLGAAGVGLLGLVYVWTIPAAAPAPLAIAAMLVYLSTPYAIRYQQEWFLRRAQALRDPVELMADERGIRATTATSDIWFAWSHYESATQVPGGAVLCLRGGAQLTWIPDPAFSGRQQQAEWYHQVSAWMGSSGVST